MGRGRIDGADAPVVGYPRPTAGGLLNDGGKDGSVRLPGLPLVVTLIFTASGLAFTFWWPAVVRHHGFYWLTPADLWSTVRSAHFVGWGGLSYVYTVHSGPGLVTLPGFPILLMPVAVLASALGLVESAPLVMLPKPSAWFVIGPCVLLSTGVALTAVDSMARRLGLRGVWGRLALLLLAAAGMFPAVVMWGHPEDALALALALMALGTAWAGQWVRTGWLLGLALVMQMYVVLLIPLFVGMAGWRAARWVVARAAFLPACLLAAVVIPDHQALKILLKQPAFPRINHATPWSLIAPSLGDGAVAGGISRWFGVVVAVACGYLAYRWREDLLRLLWLASIAMGARCVFEAVMVPYYVMPLALLSLLVIWRVSVRRGVLTVAAAAGLTVMTFSHADMWAWWLEMSALIFAVVALSYPARVSTRVVDSVDHIPVDLPPMPADLALAPVGGGAT